MSSCIPKGTFKELDQISSVVTTVFDRWGRYTPLVCQCHDTSVECRTLDSTPGNFPRPCRLILPNFFLQHTWHRYDFNISPLAGSKKSWHRLQGTKHIWRLPCGIVIPISLQWTLVFIPSRGCLGLLGFFNRVCEPFGFPPEYRTRQDNPDVNTPKEVWSLCVHRLFLCKIKASRSLYFILDQQQRRNSTTPDSCELGQTKLFPFVWWLECLFVLMWLWC